MRIMGRHFLRVCATLATALALTAALLPHSAASAPRRGESGLIYDGIPEVAASERNALLGEHLDDYLGAREARLLGWSPKGQLLIATRFGEVEQLHLIDRPLGERRQITFAHEPTHKGALCPDPNRGTLAFTRDRDGNELYQLYVQKPGETRPRALTDGKSVNGDALWSNSGRAIAFYSTARDGVSHDIEIVEPDTGALPRLVLSGDAAALIPLDWSPDDSKLLVLKRVSAAESYLYVVEVDGGKRREVDPSPAKVSIVDARFARDGQGVYLISDRDSERAHVRYVNLFTSERTELSANLAAEVDALALSRDGHYLAYASNEGGVSRLDVVDLRAHQDLVVPKPPLAGVIGALAFDPENRRLAFDLSAATQPRDVYVLDLDARRIEPWTASEPAAAAGGATPRLVQFPTFDRSEGRPRSLPAWVYEPAGPEPHPVLIVLHGGPESQFRPGFDPWLAYVVNELHIAVVAPNVRGSSGYGRSFLALDNGVLREDVVKDLGALLVWIGLQGRFDAKHVVIAGSGYGGYLALAALVNYGERLKGAVDAGGISDFASYLAGTAPELKDQRRAEYGDERDADMRPFLRRISPLTNADRITRPVLIVHGRNDRGVPISESEQLVNRLRARGATVWFLEATHAGHELERQSEREAYYRTFMQFLESLEE